MSKPIQLRKTSRESWEKFLGECYEAGEDDPEELLELFLTTPDLIRAAASLRTKREASTRSEARKVVNLNRRG